MTGRRFLARALTLGLIAVAVSSCATRRGGQSTSLPDEGPPHAEGVLGPRDLLSIRVLNEPELSGDYRVEADGTLDFPLLGAVRAAGDTPPQVADRLAAMLEDGYLRSAVVTILVREYNSRQVLVLGQVRKPGPLPFSDGMTLLEAIARAGGLTDQHAANRTTVTRHDGDAQRVLTVPFKEVSAGRAGDVALRPGDVIFVPESPI